MSFWTRESRVKELKNNILNIFDDVFILFFEDDKDDYVEIKTYLPKYNCILHFDLYTGFNHLVIKLLKYRFDDTDLTTKNKVLYDGKYLNDYDFLKVLLGHNKYEFYTQSE